MEAIHDRDLSGCNVGNHLRDEEGVELRTVFFVSTVVGDFFFESLDTTDTYTIDHTDAVQVFLLQVPATVFHGLLGSNQCQLRIAVHLAGLFAVQIVVHVEVFTSQANFVLKG